MERQKKIQLLDLDVLGMILREPKNIIKCIIIVCGNMFFQNILGNFKNDDEGNHRVVFASSLSPPLPLPRRSTVPLLLCILAAPDLQGQARPLPSNPSLAAQPSWTLLSPLLPVWMGQPTIL